MPDYFADYFFSDQPVFLKTPISSDRTSLSIRALSRSRIGESGKLVEKTVLQAEITGKDWADKELSKTFDLTNPASSKRVDGFRDFISLARRTVQYPRGRFVFDFSDELRFELGIDLRPDSKFTLFESFGIYEVGSGRIKCDLDIEKSGDLLNRLLELPLD